MNLKKKLLSGLLACATVFSCSFAILPAISADGEIQPPTPPEQLFTQYAKGDTPENWTLLMRAVAQQDVELVKSLLATSENLNETLEVPKGAATGMYHGCKNVLEGLYRIPCMSILLDRRSFRRYPRTELSLDQANKLTTIVKLITKRCTYKGMRTVRCSVIPLTQAYCVCIGSQLLESAVASEPVPYCINGEMGYITLWQALQETGKTTHAH